MSKAVNIRKGLIKNIISLSDKVEDDSFLELLGLLSITRLIEINEELKSL